MHYRLHKLLILSSPVGDRRRSGPQLNDQKYFLQDSYNRNFSRQLSFLADRKEGLYKNPQGKKSALLKDLLQVNRLIDLSIKAQNG